MEAYNKCGIRNEELGIRSKFFFSSTPAGSAGFTSLRRIVASRLMPAPPKSMFLQASRQCLHPIIGEVQARFGCVYPDGNAYTKIYLVGTGGLAAARSRSCSDTTPWCHSFHSSRFATSPVQKYAKKSRVLFAHAIGFYNAPTMPTIRKKVNRYAIIVKTTTTIMETIAEIPQAFALFGLSLCMIAQ